MRTHLFLKGRQTVEKRFEVELPEEVVAEFGWHEGEVPRKVREALVMELLRRDHLSEAQAAALLQLDRWELLDVMGRYQVPAIRLSPEELTRELAQELQRD
jgi:Uncharacterised protein family (UPF0175)